MKTFERCIRQLIWAGIIFLSPFVSQVKAVYLAPGGVLPGTFEPDPTGGTQLASQSVPFSYGVLQGTLTSSVISGDPSNPFGTGLTFTYQVAVSALSGDSASQISVSSYAGFLTDASYNPIAGGTVVPDFMSRSATPGNVVRFTFLTTPIGPGLSSALLVVQTDAALWAPTTAGITDGQTVNVSSYAPIAVPEPETCALIVMGLGLLGFRLRRSK